MYQYSCTLENQNKKFTLLTL